MRQAAATVLISALSSMTLSAQPLDARLPVCFGCHGENGQGNNELVYPRLQGQHFYYLSQQLARIKSGVREVTPAMQLVIKDLEDEELEKLANYITYLEVPKEDMATSEQWRNPDFQ